MYVCGVLNRYGMNPQDKATEMLWQYLPILEGWTDDMKTKIAAICAIIAVQEVIECLLMDWGDNTWRANEYMEFYNEVKKELEAKL